MKTFLLFIIFFTLPLQAEFEKTRLIIMADMGNEPDEEQQMAHMLMYSNMFDIEGLLAVSGIFLNKDRKDYRIRMFPELFHKLIGGYEEVYPNLQLHAPDWPTPAYLRSIVKSGTDVYGVDAIGAGNSTEASELIKASLLKDDPRPIYFVGNAGTNSLGQALFDLDEALSDAEMEELIKKIIVFENGAQDNTGAWITHKYPNIVWYRSCWQTYSYGGPGNGNDVEGPNVWQPYETSSWGQHEWAGEHIMNNHGALGELFPLRHEGRTFIEGGGTIPWIGLANQGLTDPGNLQWGGWSGRVSKTKHKNVPSRFGGVKKTEGGIGDYFMYEADSEEDEWTDPVDGKTYKNFKVPVWRFRRAMYNDFRGRMDWCVNPYDEANHNPVAAFGEDTTDNIIRMKAVPGQSIELNASATTDPDGDSVNFKWWVYNEAGTYAEEITIQNADEASTELKIPNDALNSEIHVVLEVQDENDIVSLYDYRRVVIDVVGQVAINSRL